jgi:DtxR family Mn-dependent transcriptional regulator
MTGATKSSSATVDKYLEAIFYIAAEGDVVRPGRLATWLSVSPPTVTEALGRLRRDGWIKVEPDRSVALTSVGALEAANLVRHHRILERWLTDVLGLDWASADEEADRLTSAISDSLIERIDASLDFPNTCPHGNPIPGRFAPYGKLTMLARVDPGRTAVVRRISEVAEHEARGLLSSLTQLRISEGSVLTLSPAMNGPDGLDLVVEGEAVTLDAAAARLIWVEVVA